MRTRDELYSGTLCGSLCSIWASFNFGDLLHTIIMAAIGTLASYTLSKLLQESNKNKK